MRARWVGRSMALAILGSAGCFAPAPALRDATLASAHGDYRRAQRLDDRVATFARSSTEERARARLDGAHLATRLGDVPGAEMRLEAAAQLEVPGVSEIALFEWAELIRPHDRARAQQLYYRAAAAAERRGRSYPYREAMARLVEMSLAEP